MRRPARPVFTICSALSLVVFLLVVWSWWIANFQIRPAPGGLVLVSGMADLRDHRDAGAIGKPVDPVLVAVGLGEAEGRARQSNRPVVSLLGFVYIDEPRGLTVHVPYWLLLLLSMPLPARWLWVRARDRRRRSGNACVNCGYDLRGTPDRCPECGVAAADAKQAARLAVPAGEVVPPGPLDGAGPRPLRGGSHVAEA